MAERESGQLLRVMAPGIQGLKNAEPACFRHAFDLMAEIHEMEQSGIGTLSLAAKSIDAIKRVVAADRNCQEWCVYRPGFSPQQHREEILQQQAEKSRRDFERTMEKDRRKFEIGLTVVVGVLAAAGVATPIIVAILD